MTRRFDIRNRLKDYFPIVFELLAEASLDWKSIEKTFTRKFELHEAKFNITGEPIIIEASLYHIISASKRGNPQAKRLLEFITKLLESLILRLTDKEKKLVKKNIFDLLSNLDKNYLNFVGELCVLNHLKRQENLTLIATEIPIDPKNKDGVKIDFQFYNESSKSEILIEIVNLHISDDQTTSDDKIDGLFQNKINHKLNKKDVRRTEGFMLVPVIWCSIKSIKRIILYYENNRPQFQNTSMPVCFMSFTDQHDNSIYKFGSIDSILK